MQEFDIVFHSFQDVQRFTDIASRQSFQVFVENSYQRVDAKSFMVMFSLDYRKQLRVTADCEEAEFEAFRRQVEGAIGN
jgi:phosphotransferase system HPr-like phosphotransfer protein